MPAYCADSRSAARHHNHPHLQGSPAAFGAVAGFALQARSSYQKAPRSEPNFANLSVSSPPKSTKRDRSGYLV